MLLNRPMPNGEPESFENFMQILNKGCQILVGKNVAALGPREIAWLVTPLSAFGKLFTTPKRLRTTLPDLLSGLEKVWDKFQTRAAAILDFVLGFAQGSMRPLLEDGREGRAKFAKVLWGREMSQEQLAAPTEAGKQREVFVREMNAVAMRDLI